MKTTRTLVAGLALLLTMGLQAAKKQDTFQTRSGKTVTITHIKHASIQISYEGREFYFDPVGDLEPKTDFSLFPKANFLFVTHEHFDHFDNLAISKLSTPATGLYLNKSTHAMMHGPGIVVANGDSVRLASDIWLWAVPAYNTTPEHMQFHPQGRDNGYVLQLDGLRIYVAGDTEPIPEMAELHDIDIAFLPCNQPYTMTIDQLIEAAQTIKPRVLFPYHYAQTPINQVIMRLAGSGIDVRIRDYK